MEKINFPYKLALSLCMAWVSTWAVAQTASDAFRYSEVMAGGTARSLGAGGAFGSLGADFSSASINPAGLGMYSSSEMTFTPSLTFANTDATYLGNTLNDRRSNFSIGNLGFVFANKRNSKLRTTFALGVNRLANYNNRFLLDAYNTTNSITDYYAQLGRGTSEANLGTDRPFDAGLAYYTYLINPVPGATPPQYVGITPDGNVQQTASSYVRGGKEEYLMALGLNYKSKLYFGATLGLPYTHYRSEISFAETDKNNVHGDYDGYREINTLRTQGLGINGKFGLIYRPIEQIRVGFAAHTPTRNSLEDVYEVSMTSNFGNGQQQYLQESPDDNTGFNYTVSSPWRVTTGISGTLKNLGFLSVDYEWVDYSQTEIDFGDYPQLNADVNGEIRNSYQAASNIRVGAEFARNKFRVRGGYNFYGSPYKGQNDLNRQSISAGLGFREEKLFADLAFVRSISKNDYRFYTDAPVARLNTNASTVLFTLGFRW